MDKSGKDIYLYINTEGGEVVPTMAILDTMKHIKSEVGCVAFGSARGWAGLSPAAPKASARASQHLRDAASPAGAARGQASDINNEGRELLKIRAKINEMVAEATGQSVEKVHDDIRRDFHLTAEQALDYGPWIKCCTSAARARGEGLAHRREGLRRDGRERAADARARCCERNAPRRRILFSHILLYARFVRLREVASWIFRQACTMRTASRTRKQSGKDLAVWSS